MEHNLAPIVLFVYNRLEHTKKTVEALLKNDLANQSDLFIYSDSWKNEESRKNVNNVRGYLKTIHGFKNLTIIERENNWGLANSIIDGVTTIINKYGRVIVLEDDLITSNDFLFFMNTSLEQYKYDANVFSISAYHFSIKVPKHYEYDVYFSYRSMSWGWATWVDRWLLADWNISDFNQFINDRKKVRSFNRAGSDLTKLLKMQKEGLIDSWSIRWDYTQFKNNGLTLFPLSSKVLNIGFDESGVHCGISDIQQQILNDSNAKTYKYVELIQPDRYFTRQIYLIHKNGIWKKIRRKIQMLFKD